VPFIVHAHQKKRLSVQIEHMLPIFGNSQNCHHPLSDLYPGTGIIAGATPTPNLLDTATLINGLPVCFTPAGNQATALIVCYIQRNYYFKVLLSWTLAKYKDKETAFGYN
jgi:hypothetical protein